MDPGPCHGLSMGLKPQGEEGNPDQWAHLSKMGRLAVTSDVSPPVAPTAKKKNMPAMSLGCASLAASLASCTRPEVQVHRRCELHAAPSMLLSAAAPHPLQASTHRGSRSKEAETPSWEDV